MRDSSDTPTLAHGAGMPPPSPPTMTYEQFLDAIDEDTLAEWVDGRVIMASPASRRHQEIAELFFMLLSTFAKVHASGVVISPPFQMKLARSGREPDVLYLAADHVGRLKDTYLDGPADLVIEVLSPESAGRDRGDKFYEYRDASIPEYWLIDPLAEQAEFYQLDAHGRYQSIAPDAHGVYHARILPGFWLRVDWLWQRPLPDPTRALLEIDRDAYGQYLRDQLRQAGVQP